MKFKILLFLLGVFLIVNGVNADCTSSCVIVNETGTGYDSIQDAINSATENQTVIITNSSIYNEDVVLNVSGVILTSNSTTFPTINGTSNLGSNSATMFVISNNTMVSNVNIHYNGTSQFTGAMQITRYINPYWSTIYNVSINNVNFFNKNNNPFAILNLPNRGINITISNCNISSSTETTTQHLYGIYIESNIMNVTLNNNIVSLIGSSSSANYQYGYFLMGMRIRGSNVTLLNNQVNVSLGFSYYIDGTNITAGTTNLIFNRPLYYYETPYTTFENLTNIGVMVLNKATNATIKNNTFDMAGIILINSNNTYITNNTMDTSKFVSIYVDSFNTTISYNVINSNSTAIEIKDTDSSYKITNTTISFNNITNNITMPIIQVIQSYSTNILSNNLTATGNCHHGIFTTMSNYLNVSSNNFTSTTCNFAYPESTSNQFWDGDTAICGTGGCMYIEGTIENSTFQNLNLTCLPSGVGGGITIQYANRNIFRNILINCNSTNAAGINFIDGSITNPRRTYNNSLYNITVYVNNSNAVVFERGATNNTIYNSYFHSNYGNDTMLKTTSGNYPTTNNYLVNCSFNKTRIGVNDVTNNQTLYVQYHLDVNVNDTIGNPLNNVNVVIKDVYGDTVYSGQTDSSGNIPQQILTEFLANRTYNATNGYYYFSNYTVDVSKSGYVTDSTQLNMTENQALNFELFGDEWIVDYTYKYGGLISKNIYNMFKLGSIVPYIIAGTLVIGGIVAWILV